MRAVAIEQGKLVPIMREIGGPAHGEVQIKIAYTGINRADLLQVEGNYKPPEGASDLPGLEVSGTIIAIGTGVVGWSMGEEVCALLSGGGYAEYANAPATQLLSLPSSVDLKAAASLPEGCATAYMALAQLGHMKSHERVLVHGGASGTGILIAQVAGAFGAEVFATAGGEEKCTALREYGIRAINHQIGNFAEQLMKATQNEGVDVIIDILGAPQLATHFKLLRTGGRLVSLAFMEGNVAESLKVSAILMKHLTWSGATLRGKSLLEKANIVKGVKEHIWPHLATDTIRPVVDEVFPLELAEKAHQRMQERLHIGKILLEVAPQKGTGELKN